MEKEDKRGYLNEDFRLFHTKDQVSIEFSYHYHDFDKIVVFISGSVTYVIEGKAYFLKPWDILLVPHNQIHRPIIDISEPYERIVIWVKRSYLFDNSPDGESLSTCFELAKQRSFALIRPDNAQRMSMLRTLNNIENSSRSTEFASSISANSSFLQFMVDINRLAMRDNFRVYPDACSSDPKVEAIIAYINANLENDLSLDTLSKRFFISKSYLMHKFKEFTGCSAHKYIQQKRLMWAADMMREGVPVVEASSKCGFRDYSAFLRAFKKLFGSTPSDMI